MKHNDRSINRLLSRRKLLTLMSAIGAGLLGKYLARQAQAAQSVLAPTPANPITSLFTELSTAIAAATEPPPACIVRPEQTEGPYFVDEALNRSDIRSNPSDGSVKAGVPLQLRFRVSQIHESGCEPLAGAIVDIWHCDAIGVYSDVNESRFNTLGQKFLRGYQVTDANGTARFLTIYPGWYLGRTVHIHFKIRTNAMTQAATPVSVPGRSAQNNSAQRYEFTSQLYFDDAITDRVYAQEPYASQGQRTLNNEQDGIFQYAGDQLLLSLNQVGQGYAATFDIGLETNRIDE